MGSASPQEMAALESRRRRAMTIVCLTDLLATREAELKEEIKSENPNMSRVYALRAIIDNLQSTLRSAKR